MHLIVGGSGSKTISLTLIQSVIWVSHVPLDHIEERQLWHWKQQHHLSTENSFRPSRSFSDIKSLQQRLCRPSLQRAAGLVGFYRCSLLSSYLLQSAPIHHLIHLITSPGQSRRRLRWPSSSMTAYNTTGRHGKHTQALTHRIRSVNWSSWETRKQELRDKVVCNLSAPDAKFIQTHKPSLAGRAHTIFSNE